MNIIEDNLKLELEKSILIAMNGLLLQMLNGDISFDDAEDLLFLPKNLRYLEDNNLNREMIELFEECMVIDALILFNKFQEEGLIIQRKIQRLLRNYRDVTYKRSVSLSHIEFN